MRILRIIGSVDPDSGGPVEALLRSSDEMARVGHLTEVASLDMPDAPFLASTPIQVYPLGERNLLSRFRYSSLFTPWLRRNAPNYDIAVIEGLWNYSSIGAWRALAGGVVPYVVFVHGMMDPWFKETYPLKHLAKTLYWAVGEGRVLRDAAYVLFTAEEERELARGIFPLHRYRERVIAFGTADVHGDTKEQVAAWRRYLPALDGRRYLLFLGRIHPKKGCDILIRAFADLAIVQPDLDLVIAGPDQVGWRHELEALADKCEIGHRVHWSGMVAGDIKWGAFKGAEAFVLPSHQENFGLVVAEAMACRTPVLISKKVNIWREIETSGAGMAAADTEEGTYQMLSDFLSLDAAKRKMISEAARRCFLAYFEISRTAQEFAITLAEVAKR
jgi:glycosyltransferase involved in cell wall biosynthesis